MSHDHCHPAPRNPIRTARAPSPPTAALAALLTALAALVALPAPVGAQVEFLSEDPGTPVEVRVAAQVMPGTLRPGEFGRLALEVEIAPPWYIYSLHRSPDNGPPTRILLDTPALRPAREAGESPPTAELDTVAGAVYTYHRPRARFWLDVQVRPEAAPGPLTLRGALVYAACDGRICLPERRAPFTAALTLAEGPPRAAHRTPPEGDE